jgi:SET domain-containing protein
MVVVMCVKSHARASGIEGVGVFAGAPVARGTVVWRYLPPLDQAWSREAVRALPELQRRFIEKYGYWDTGVGAYVLCGDHGRFMNHSDAPNVVGHYPDGPGSLGVDIATRDIAAGEEFTCDYNSFDEDAHGKLAADWR